MNLKVLCSEAELSNGVEAQDRIDKAVAPETGRAVGFDPEDRLGVLGVDTHLPLGVDPHVPDTKGLQTKKVTLNQQLLKCKNSTNLPKLPNEL